MSNQNKTEKEIEFSLADFFKAKIKIRIWQLGLTLILGIILGVMIK